MQIVICKSNGMNIREGERLHQKKCHLYTYPPEFEIYIQNCVYKPELHEKGRIILAC